MVQNQRKKIIEHIRQGDIIRVVWKDACEGSAEVKLSQMRPLGLRECIDSTLVSIGRFLRCLDDRLILDEVIREEAGSKVIYEKEATGKWLSIPIGVVSQVAALARFDQLMIDQTKKRRTIFKQLRFIPRSTRLPNGELSRKLYLT